MRVLEFGGWCFPRTVHSIELPHRPGDKITVVMDLDSRTHDIVKQDSVASIETGACWVRVYGDLVRNCRGGQRARR